jgi:Sulfotransferase family
VRFGRARPGKSRGSELDELESRLVWILGGPRTGSTWLLELLTYPLTPSAQSPSGAGMREQSSVCPFAIPVNEPYLGMHLAPIVSFGSGGVFTAAEARNLLGPDPSYFFAEDYADVWRPQLRRLVLERIAAQAEVASREHGLQRPLVVVKEPNGSHAAPILTSTLPRSRVLFLLRDGRDVLDSLADAESPGGWLEAGSEAAGVTPADSRIEFFRTNAWLWVHRIAAVQQAVAAHPAELSMTVRYEDLRRDTAPVLRDIVGWLGVELDETAVGEAVAATSFEDYPPEAKGPGKPLRVASPGHWRESMSEAEQETITAVMGDKLGELGYEI